MTSRRLRRTQADTAHAPGSGQTWEVTFTNRTSLGYHRGVAGGGRRDAWTLLSSHGHVLVEIVRDPDARIRDLSAAAGITERATAGIIADLESAGYVTRTRVGRRNRYVVNRDLGFRDAPQRDLRVGPFLELLTAQPSGDADGGPNLLPSTTDSASVEPTDAAGSEGSPGPPVWPAPSRAAGRFGTDPRRRAEER